MKPLSSRFTQNRIYICVCLVNFFLQLLAAVQARHRKASKFYILIFWSLSQKTERNKDIRRFQVQESKRKFEGVAATFIWFLYDISDSSILLRKNILPKKTFRTENTLKLKARQSSCRDISFLRSSLFMSLSWGEENSPWCLVGQINYQSLAAWSTLPSVLSIVSSSSVWTAFYLYFSCE